jgi:cytochrome c-type biogenesis protein
MGLLLILTGIMFLTGSMNWLGQWLLDNVPVLSRVEELTTPKSLQQEIMRRGTSQ